MGSEVSLSRQGSLYDLTFNEVQNHLGNVGKPLGSMNLDELLRTLMTGPAQLNMELSKKTVEELWREIQERQNINTLGEMTLEEFLAQAGVSVNNTSPGLGIDQNVAENSEWIQYQMIQQQQMSNVAIQPQPVVEKTTVERRKKRMIKNRESAARSRARRQAYTQELENKVSRLEDDNRRLRRIKVVEEIVPPSAPPPPKPKIQLRRTSSSPL